MTGSSKRKTKGDTEQAKGMYSLETLNQLEIPVVPKDQNPTTAPEVSPIETFWKHLKMRIYQGGRKAQNVQEIVTERVSMDIVNKRYKDQQYALTMTAVNITNLSSGKQLQ